MKKTFKTFAAIAVLACSAFHAQGADLSRKQSELKQLEELNSGESTGFELGYYARVDLGYTFADFTNGVAVTDEIPHYIDSFDDSEHLGHFRVGLGIDTGLGIRVDATLAHNAKVESPIEPNDLMVTDYLVNGYYDVSIMGFEPFIGAGVGAALTDIENLNPTTKLAYAGHAGIRTDVLTGFDVELGYRYLQTKDVLDNDVSLHTGTLGLLYGF